MYIIIYRKKPRSRWQCWATTYATRVLADFWAADMRAHRFADAKVVFGERPE